MEKIFIIGRSDDDYAKTLDAPLVHVPLISQDEEIHDFIQNNLLNVDCDRFIICINDIKDIILFLRIGLHIRLSEELLLKRFNPILYVSSFITLDTAIKNGNIYGHLLSTKGCHFESAKTKEIIKEAISHIESLNKNNYKREFLDLISVLPDEKTGRHSIANQWGAISLDKAANTGVFNSNEQLKKFTKFLYFKYIFALNDNYSRIESTDLKILGHITLGKPDRIESNDYKILLIDDEAEKGWESVLRKIFKTSKPENFQVIEEKVADYEGFSDRAKKLITEGNFDLFLIDLRLNGIDEETTLKPADFSGTKVLQQIKKFNMGNQVIIFTASNKAWNMKYLLDEGARGYYIKESPEYNFTHNYSVENYTNFKKSVSDSFSLAFLRDISIIQERIIGFVSSDYLSKLPSYKSFYDRTIAFQGLAVKLLEKIPDNPKYFSLAYLLYYQILEDYSNQRENFNYKSRGYFVLNNTKGVVIYSSTNSEWQWELKYIKDPSNGGYFIKEQELRKDDPPISSLAKISFVLAFKFSKDDAFLKKWGYLNNLRNSVAGHGGTGRSITKQELFDLLEIVELFLTNP